MKILVFYVLKRFYKKAASIVLRVISKHTSSLAKSVVDAGALKPLVKCLEEFDPSVKQFAAGAIKTIAMYRYLFICLFFGLKY